MILNLISTTSRTKRPEHELPDLINGVDETPAIYDPTSGNGSGVFEEDDENKIRKFHVNGVTVKVLAKRVQYYDADGKLVTESFEDYTRKTLLKDKDYASLDDFISQWLARGPQTAHHQ